MRSNLFGFVLFVLFIAGSSGNDLERKPLSKTYQITAGFLLQFASFVDWPSPLGGNLYLCIVGNDPFASYIDDMVKANSTNRNGDRLVIQRMLVGRPVEHCQVIFITKSEVGPSFWQSLPTNHSILLVSDYSNFVKQGGLISVYPENKRMRLAVNLRLTKKGHLSISSQLLKLALIVESGVGEEK